LSDRFVIVSCIYFTGHCLRHTFASRLLMSGVALGQVQTGP
jgi:site-specific recombinase XerD